MAENKINKPEQDEEKKKKKGLPAWWDKLSKGAKIGISAGSAVVLSSAIVFPTLAATVWNKGGDMPKVRELTKIDVTTTPTTYEVGNVFDTNNLSVVATWNDGTVVDVGYTEYTVSPEFPYTFTNDDVANGKDFTVTYLTKSQTVHVGVQYKTLEATWLDNKYLSDDAGSVLPGTSFNGIIKYSTDDDTGFNAISMTTVHGDKVELKINNPTATINVTQVKNANGVDITSNCTVDSNYNLLTPNSSLLKENLSITFTVTSSLYCLYLHGDYLN